MITINRNEVVDRLYFPQITDDENLENALTKKLTRTMQEVMEEYEIKCLVRIGIETNCMMEGADAGIYPSLQSSNEIQLSINGKFLHDILHSIRTDNLKQTLTHEIKHFLDRDFLSSRAKRLEDMVDRKHPHKYSGIHPTEVNTTNYRLDYLRKLKTEGFAEFQGGIGEDEAKFKEELRKQTKTVDAVFAFLNTGYMPIDLIDIPDEQKEAYKEKLQIDGSLDPYEQGHYMYRVIALAEMKKQGVGFQEQMPTQMYHKLSEKLLKIKTYSQWFDEYYKAAKVLGLTEEELIVKQKHARILIEFEKKYEEKKKKMPDLTNK